VNITTEQRTQITQAFTRVNVQPVTNVSFNVSVGVVVPTDVTLHTCPGEVVRVLPGVTECRFVIVRDRVVIVEPSSRRIITVVEYRG